MFWTTNIICAIVVLAACVILVSCGTSPVDTVQPSLNIISDTETVSQSLITGSFSECSKIGGDLIIIIGSGVEFGLVQIHNNPSMPWFDTWEFNTKILFQWDYDNGELRVSDPNNFLTNSSYLYRIQLFR